LPARSGLGYALTKPAEGIRLLHESDAEERYEAVNAMLLNEFLKEHRKNEEQQATMARLIATDTRQQKQIEALTAALQKVSAQLEVSESVPRTVLNDR
jgi:hypothetical protein